MFQYPIIEHTLEEWKSKVAVDTYTATILARATTLSLKDSIEFPTGAISSQNTTSHILELANTLQDILGEAMDLTTTMFPHKVAPPPPSRGTLPRHLWPNSVRHDVSEIRIRAKAVRRLVRIEANPSGIEPDKPPLADTHQALWNDISKPMQLRIRLLPLPRGHDTLGLLTREDPSPQR